jgi:hypothetical protein
MRLRIIILLALLFPRLGKRTKREMQTQRMTVRVSWTFHPSKKDPDCSLIQPLKPITLSDPSTRRILPLKVQILLKPQLRRVLTLNGLVVLLMGLILINLVSKSNNHRGEYRCLSPFTVRLRRCFTLMKKMGSSLL